MGALALVAALLVGVPVLLIVVAEVGIRLIVPAERWRYVDPTHNWQLDPTLGWVHRSNLDSFIASELSRDVSMTSP